MQTFMEQGDFNSSERIGYGYWNYFFGVMAMIGSMAGSISMCSMVELDMITV